MKGCGVEVYMDDIVIHAKSRYEHDVFVKRVMRKSDENNMKVNIKKIQFTCESI